MVKEKPVESVEITESYDFIEKLINSMGDIVVTTPEEVTQSISERLLKAESLEQLLSPQSTVEAKSILGKPIVVTDVHWNRSTLADNEGQVYAVIDAIIDGVPAAVTTGSRTIMIQVLKAKQAGWLPMDVQIKESPQRTAAGFKPMWFEAVTPGSGSVEGNKEEEPF